MNKPKTIYVIAVWAFFQTAFYVSIPLEVIGKVLVLSPEVIKILKLCGQICSIVVIVGLVQLKRVPKIILVILLSVASLLILKIIVTLLYIGSNHNLRTYASLSVMLAINMGCVWYLLRKKFVDFSFEFRNHVELQKKLTTPIK